MDASRRSFLGFFPGALAAAAFLAGCAGLDGYEPPEVKLADLRFLDATLFEQRVLVTLDIVNPNDFALPVDGARFKLELNGQPFATGLSNQTVTVPRLGRANIEAEATISTLDLARQVFALGGGREALDYRLVGTAFVSGLSRRDIAFEQKGALGLSPAAPAGGSGPKAYRPL